MLPGGTLCPDVSGEGRGGADGLTLLEGLSDKVDLKVTKPHDTAARVEKALPYETQEDADEARRLKARRFKRRCGIIATEAIETRLSSLPKGLSP